VLWIDRAPTPALAVLREALRQARVLVDVTEDRLKTIARAALYEYDLILVDAGTDNNPADPLSWLPDVMARCPSVPVAIRTTTASYSGSVAAAKLGVFAHIETPDTVEAVRALLRKAQEWQTARRAGAEWAG
jgi:DNA-binding NtrC family response regulator